MRRRVGDTVADEPLAVELIEAELDYVVEDVDEDGVASRLRATVTRFRVLTREGRRDLECPLELVVIRGAPGRIEGADGPLDADREGLIRRVVDADVSAHPDREGWGSFHAAPSVWPVDAVSLAAFLSEGIHEVASTGVEGAHAILGTLLVDGVTCYLLESRYRARTTVRLPGQPLEGAGVLVATTRYTIPTDARWPDMRVESVLTEHVEIPMGGDGRALLEWDGRRERYVERTPVHAE